MESKVLNVNEKSDDNTEVVYKPLTYGKQDLLVAEKGVGNKRFFLYFCVLTADFLTFSCGCSFVWSSPAIPKLKSTDPHINPLGVPITPIQQSWIASLPALGAAIGPVLIGKFADTYGRKKALIFICFLKVTSFVALAFATDIHVYYATRLLLGIGAGMVFTILPSYIGETCEDHNRGTFGCIMGVFLGLGVLYAIAVGPLLSIKLFTLSCAIPPIYLIICLVLVIPETPVYLASAGKKEEAKQALTKLRNKKAESVEEDLLEILRIIEESSNSKSGRGSYLELLKTLTLRKALVICVGLCCLQQISGVNAILAFIEPVFNMTGGEISSYIAAIIVATVKVIGVIVASIVVEKLGRKYLLMISTISCAVSLIVLGVYFYLKSVQFQHLQSIFWLPMASLMTFICVYNIGLGPVPWAIMSEIFPSNLKATASSVVTTFCAFTSFLVTFLFPILMGYLGPANCFYMFGGFCAFGGVFIYFGVPETRGKNIVEIQRMLSKSK